MRNIVGGIVVSTAAMMILAVQIPTASSGTPQGSTSASSSAVAATPPHENPFPLIVRIDKSALSRYIDNEYDERRPVKENVLGARVVGQSRTQGASRAELLPDDAEAAFDVRFSGTTLSKTVGTQEPGVVYSRTLTNFACKQRVVFDPRRGFVKIGEPTIEGDTQLAYEGFGSTRNLGQRLIRRIAERRSYQMFEPARRIADHDNKRDTLKGFEQEVDKTLQAANDGLDLVHYVNRFLGKEAQLQLFAKSSPDCIQIEIGPQGRQFTARTALPASAGPKAPIEIWAHYSLLGSPIIKLLDLAAAKDELPRSLQDQIDQALFPSLTAQASDSAVDFDLRDGWLVMSLPDDVVAPPAGDNMAQRQVDRK